MVKSHPARSALSPLSVNRLGLSSTAGSAKHLSARKRPIQDVDEPEKDPSICKSRLSPSRARVYPDASSPIPDVTATPEPQSPAASTREFAGAKSNGDMVMEDVAHSQQSNQASTASSVVDYDPDDTMETQQTAATEVSQSLQPRISQQVEMLRLRLRLAQFKIQTNQTNTPFTQLRLSTTSDASSPQPQPLDPAHGLLESNAKSLESFLPPSRPRLAIDRNVLKPQSSIEESPSSPPASFEASTGAKDRANLPEDETSEQLCRDTDENSQTPALPRFRLGAADLKEDTLGKEGSFLHRLAQERECEENLTSSVIRGKAAIGLLGLRGEA